MFDFFILCTDESQLSDAEIRIVKHLNETSKCFSVVNLNQEEEQKEEERDLLHRIRDRMAGDLEKAKVFTSNVIAVSASRFTHPLKWDLTHFYSNLVSQLDTKRLGSLIYSIGPWAKEVIVKKTSFLRNRIYYIAIINCVSGVFIPDLAISVDIMALSKEISFYLEQLGLNHKYYELLRESRGVLYPKINSILERSKYESFFSAANVKEISDLLSRYMPLFIVSSNAVTLSQNIPIIGNIKQRSRK